MEAARALEYITLGSGGGGDLEAETTQALVYVLYARGKKGGGVPAAAAAAGRGLGNSGVDSEDTARADERAAAAAFGGDTGASGGGAAPPSSSVVKEAAAVLAKVAEAAAATSGAQPPGGAVARAMAAGTALAPAGPSAGVPGLSRPSVTSKSPTGGVVPTATQLSVGDTIGRVSMSGGIPSPQLAAAEKVTSPNPTAALDLLRPLPVSFASGLRADAGRVDPSSPLHGRAGGGGAGGLGEGGRGPAFLGGGGVVGSSANSTGEGGGEDGGAGTSQHQWQQVN